MKILIVEDEELLREMLVELVSLDYEAVAVEDVDRALKAVADAEARGTPFEAIITDFNLGTKSGLDLIQEVRRKQKAARVKVLMVSAQMDADLARKAFLSGANAVLPKPFRTGEILKILSDWKAAPKAAPATAAS